MEKIIYSPRGPAKRDETQVEPRRLASLLQTLNDHNELAGWLAGWPSRSSDWALKLLAWLPGCSWNKLELQELEPEPAS